jgi:uncharacterized protein YegL
MPRLNNSNAAQVTGNFTFSDERLENLTGSSKYTLVSIAVDVSTSVGAFEALLLACLKDAVDSCKKSPFVDSLLVRVVKFGSQVQEVHGFKLLKDINTSDYDKEIKCSGCTALYDATENIIDRTLKYGANCAKNGGLTVNALCIVITDGENNSSVTTTPKLKTLLADAVRNEELESLATDLVGVNTGSSSGLSKYLQDFKDEVGFRDFIDMKDANPKSFAKLHGWISKSVSSSSQACGTGGPSQAVVF